MMQSNSVNTMLFIPRIPGNDKTGTVKGLLSGDDTFMKMLGEKIAEIKIDKLQPQHVDRKMNFTKRGILKDETGPVNERKPGPTTRKLDKEPEKVNAASGQETEDAKSDEKGIREKISSLEALIALLEELMARLSLKNVSVASGTLNDSQELILSAENKGISPIELLMSLVKEDAVTLKAIMNESGNSINTHEINQLLEKIQTLLEKLSGDRDMPLLKAEIVRESVSMEELTEQLRNQCRQLIDKLNEQVSGPNVTLNDESVREEQVLSESVKTEPMSRHDAKDAEKDFSALAEDVDASQVKLYDDMDNYFESIIAQNRQIPGESEIQPEVTEKLWFPLAERPLAHTVTNQVAMKIKVMAGENKQEMEMQLKPESLGRLTLKIIHERGEILARITAENQQVKAILESNMQMLKDALERSGLNVQNLSVSAENNRDNRHNKESGDDKGKVYSAGLSRKTGASSQAETDKLSLRARIEKEYFKDISRINLTA
ncbi:MAG: flagellar hook-length control protein FliK [Clostridiaceae bacterium]|nr:flagellar hook-length control protein FliK [Clostridiaceae bacterium]